MFVESNSTLFMCISDEYLELTSLLALLLDALEGFEVGDNGAIHATQMQQQKLGIHPTFKY